MDMQTFDFMIQEMWSDVRMANVKQELKPWSVTTRRRECLGVAADVGPCQVFHERPWDAVAVGRLRSARGCLSRPAQSSVPACFSIRKAPRTREHNGDIEANTRAGTDTDKPVSGFHATHSCLVSYSSPIVPNCIFRSVVWVDLRKTPQKELK